MYVAARRSFPFVPACESLRESDAGGLLRDAQVIPPNQDFTIEMAINSVRRFSATLCS